AFVPINMAMSAYLFVTGFRAVAWRLLVVEIAPAVVIGAAIGLALFHLPAKGILALVFGVFVAGLALLRLVRPADRPLAPVLRIAMLVIGGVAHGLFGTGGPMIVYVARRRLDNKRAFRATLAVLWLSLNTALLVNFYALGLYGDRTVELGGAILCAMIPGLIIGERVHRALDTTQFERIVWILLLVAGSALAVRSAFAL
ncbi:MAG: TSUP family transporter, partial [Kofleriaceae bacterium]